MTELARGSGWNGANPWRLGMWAGIVAILVLPLVAMRFTNQVAWTGFDFAAAATLLIGAGAIFELAARTTRSGVTRATIGAVLFGVVALIWAEGAVGVF